MRQKVNAIINGHEILKVLANQQHALGVTEVSKMTGISPSSCFNILKTLVDLGLASFNVETKRYKLGFAIFELARQGMSHKPLLMAVQPYLVTLAEKFQASFGLWSIDSRYRAVLIAISQNSIAHNIQLQIGTRQPIAAGATGRAILSRNDVSYLNNSPWLNSQFQKVIWQGEITLNDYREQVIQAKKVGYAVDKDQYFEGMSAISSVFEERNTGRLHAITAVLYSAGLENQVIESVGQELKLIAKELSKLEY